MAQTLTTLDDLLIEQLADLYDAEQQLVKALPKMAEAASEPRLRKALEEHLRQTERHVQGIEQVFERLDQKPRRERCEAMAGLIAEGQQVIEEHGKSPVKDIALVAAAQRVEHYEIAGYGNARAFAKHLGHTQAATILDRILDEEGQADQLLTKITQDVLLAEAPQRAR